MPRQQDCRGFPVSPCLHGSGGLMWACGARWTLSWVYECGLFCRLHLGLHMVQQTAVREAGGPPPVGSLTSIPTDRAAQNMADRKVTRWSCKTNAPLNPGKHPVLFCPLLPIWQQQPPASRWHKRPLYTLQMAVSIPNISLHVSCTRWNNLGCCVLLKDAWKCGQEGPRMCLSVRWLMAFYLLYSCLRYKHVTIINALSHFVDSLLSQFSAESNVQIIWGRGKFTVEGCKANNRKVCNEIKTIYLILFWHIFLRCWNDVLLFNSRVCSSCIQSIRGADVLLISDPLHLCDVTSSDKTWGFPAKCLCLCFHPLLASH